MIISRSISRSISRPIVFSSAVQRYFTDYDASLQSYDEFTSPINFGGDFVIRAKVNVKSYPVAGSLKAFIGKKSSSLSRLAFGVNDDGSIRLDAPGHATRIDSAFNIDLNKTYTVEVSRTGATAKIKNISTGEESSGAFTTSTLTIDVTSQHLNSNYLDGIESDLYIENAGTLVGDFPLDEGPDSMIRINRADPLNNATRFNQPASQDNLFTRVNGKWEGEERVDLSAWSYPTGFTRVGDTIEVDGTAADFSVAFINGVLEVGAIYRAGLKYVGTGTVQYRVGGGIGNNTGDHVVDTTKSALNTQIGVNVSDDNPIGVFSELTAKRVLEEA